MPKYYVRSPASGAWFRRPGLGSSLNHEEAHPYPEDDPWLRCMVHDAKAFGRRLVLRQVQGQDPTCKHGNRGPCLYCAGIIDA